MGPIEMYSLTVRSEGGLARRLLVKALPSSEGAGRNRDIGAV
jgi:hypothetical protein